MSDYLAGPGWTVLALILAIPAAPVARLGAVDVHVVRVLGAFAQLGPVLQIGYKTSPQFGTIC